MRVVRWERLSMRRGREVSAPRAGQASGLASGAAAISQLRVRLRLQAGAAQICGQGSAGSQ